MDAPVKIPYCNTFRTKFHPDREKIIYLVLMAIAAFLHFYGLDWRAVHHDESLHAIYSWYLAVGRGYQHDPMMHGPFLFHTTALAYKLFGDSNFTMRIIPALFGTVLVGLPYFLRNQIGKIGSLVAAVLLMISPSLLYFGRFIRNDIYMVTWALLMVIFMWYYIEKGKNVFLYAFAAVLSLSFTTKETSFFIAGIFGSFLLIITAREWVNVIRNRFNFTQLSRPAELLLVLVTLVLPQCGAALSLIQNQLGITLAASPYGIPSGIGLGVAIGTLAILLIIAAVLGLHWKKRVWIICAVIFYVIYICLFTTFFTNYLGLGSGFWTSLSYWIIQHGVKRGGQPWYMYLLLISNYEFLPAIFGIAGGIFFLRRKNNILAKFFIYWSITSLIIYSWSGEKMPWLMIHITLPLILLSAIFINYILEHRQRALKIIVTVPFIILLVFTGRVTVQTNYDYSATKVEMLVYSQGAQEIELVMAEIDRLASQSPEDKGISIVIDNDLSWPWVWYLRDYTNINYVTLDGSYVPAGAEVLFITPYHLSNYDNLAAGYGDSTTFPQIIWFPQGEYMNNFNILSKETWKRGWNYFLHRTTTEPYTESYDKVITVFFPQGFDLNMAGMKG